MDKSEVQEKIRAAFADVPYPGDDNIGHPNGRDDAENVTELLRGIDWKEVPNDCLWPDAISWMTQQAFHYYFAAYLLASLDKDAGDVTDSVIRHLTPNATCSHDVLTERRFAENYAGFSSAQKQAIRDFLDYELEKLHSRYRKRKVLVAGADGELRRLRDYW
jgi:hypothetical protein